MNLHKTLIFTTILITPFTTFADVKYDGNSYEINQYLKSQMANFESKINQLENHDIVNFKNYRDKICNDISSTYEGGSYKSVKYGNCVVSLDKWYIQQAQR
ncbi:DUF1311 domain-containing protein [Francisella adeliensis]|uniref:DUF1311 domain-containing protein n=1 Tax=Francisella adeliensis TaxID=2007306 RepID=UPI001F2FEA77|nr:DUF1311 domain-containing protein [Francisella adeliensis]